MMYPLGGVSNRTLERMHRLTTTVALLALSACGGEAPTPESVCINGSDLDQVPAEYLAAVTKYTTTNTEFLVTVCTEDTDGDGDADFLVVESSNRPEHESAYFDDEDSRWGDFDYETNIYKFEELYDGQTPRSAGNNKIEEQVIIMKMPITPTEATDKTSTSFGTIGLALNGVSFFNENAAPGDDIRDELFTFDQCSGHPQMTGVYHYHVDPVCLIRDLGGDVEEKSINMAGEVYEWLEDTGANGNLLLGFLMDGFPVYGPVGDQEVDCEGNAVDPGSIDEYNGHSHCNTEFSEPMYHYHVKTALYGGQDNAVFWITDEFFFGSPGEVLQ